MVTGPPCATDVRQPCVAKLWSPSAKRRMRDRRVTIRQSQKATCEIKKLLWTQRAQCCTALRADVEEFCLNSSSQSFRVNNIIQGHCFSNRQIDIVLDYLQPKESNQRCDSAGVSMHRQLILSRNSQSQEMNNVKIGVRKCLGEVCHAEALKTPSPIPEHVSVKASLDSGMQIPA